MKMKIFWNQWYIPEKVINPELWFSLWFSFDLCWPVSFSIKPKSTQFFICEANWWKIGLHYFVRNAWRIPKMFFFFVPWALSDFFVRLEYHFFTGKKKISCVGHQVSKYSLFFTSTQLFSYPLQIHFLGTHQPLQDCYFFLQNSIFVFFFW